MKKKANKKRLPPVFPVNPHVIEIIRCYDIQWFVKRVKMKHAKKVVEERLSQKISAANFKFQVDHCKTEGLLQFWKVAKRKSTNSRDLTDQGWFRLRQAVFNLSLTLQGMTLEDGCEIIRTVVPTNVVQLLGLPKRLHFWLDQSAE